MAPRPHLDEWLREFLTESENMITLNLSVWEITCHVL
jgi:hypothetical protein